MLTLWQVLLSGERSGVPKDSASDGQEQPWTLQDLEPLQPVVPKVCQPIPGTMLGSCGHGPELSEASA